VNAIGPAYAKYANALQENGITGGLVDDMSIAEIEEVYHRPYGKALDSRLTNAQNRNLISKPGVSDLVIKLRASHGRLNLRYYPRFAPID
jgi:hypothetical protein